MSTRKVEGNTPWQTRRVGLQVLRDTVQDISQLGEESAPGLSCAAGLFTRAMLVTLLHDKCGQTESQEPESGGKPLSMGRNGEKASFIKVSKEH